MTTFNGFEPANTTPVPDTLFDVLLSKLSGAELKVMLYIIRRTLGFKKTTDTISFTQFEKGIITSEGKILDEGTGLSRETISRSLQSLEEKGCIKSDKGYTPQKDKDTTLYSILFSGEEGVVGKSDHTGSRKSVLPVVGKTDYGSRIFPLGVVGKSDLQETVLQDTDKQETVLQEREEVADATARSHSSSQENVTLIDDDDTEKRESVRLFTWTLGPIMTPITFLNSDDDTEQERTTPSQKEVVDGHEHPHQHPVVDHHLPADNDQPERHTRATNMVTEPPSPRKQANPVRIPKRPKQQPLTMPEVELTSEEQAVFDAWCSLFKVGVPLIPANVKACKQLMKPLQVWTGILHKSTAEVLKLIMDWAYKNDKNGYYKRGFKLYDAAREFEGWQSAQERSTDKEPSNEHKATPKMYSGEWLMLPAEERWKIAQSEVRS